MEIAELDWVDDNEAKLAGRFLTIVLEETLNPVVWRPVTGWPASAAEEAYYWQENP